MDDQKLSSTILIAVYTLFLVSAFFVHHTIYMDGLYVTNTLLYAAAVLLGTLIAVLALLFRCHIRLRKQKDILQTHVVQTEKQALLFRMVAGITHDINSQIGVVISAFSFLKDKNTEISASFARDELTKSALEEHLHTEAETASIVSVNLSKIAELVGSFKRLSVDQAHEEIDTFDVRDYLEQILVSMHPRIRKTSVAVRLDCQPGILLTCWPGGFSQIVTNLLDNALTHAYGPGETGEVLIAASSSDDTLYLEVADSGAGMSDSVREHIFEPFYTTRQHEGGTGLGLFVVHMLVHDSLGGAIRCESFPGKGTRFIMTIPLVGRNRSVANGAY